MADIIKKFKTFFVKNVSEETLTRKSFGREFKCFLYCSKTNKKFQSQLIHPLRNLQKETIQIIYNDERLFNDSIFEGEYYNGIFYITCVLKCDIENIQDISIQNTKDGKLLNESDISGDWEYSFNYKTFDETYKKIDKIITKKVIKDNNFIEIYRDNDTNDILRVKDISTSKKLKNLFSSNTILELPVVFNEKFSKFEINV